MAPDSQSHAPDARGASVDLVQASFSPGRDPGRHDLATTIDEFHQMLGGIKNDLIGRENLVDQLGYALLTREHQLIVGPAGVGKSLYARSAFSRIRDDRPGYYISLTNETSKGELFGGLNLEEFEKGRYIYNTEGYITQAHFAILNEMFDAPVKLLRTLNDVLNERVFESGPQREAVRLLSAIALSNYLASGQAAEAVLDRFIFKATVGASTTPTERYQLRKHFLVSHGKVRTIPDEEKLDVDKLLFLSEVIHGENSHHPLSYSRSVLVLLDAIFAEYESRYEGTFGGDSEVGRFEISDRTKNKSLHLLGASALLSGRTEIKAQDLRALSLLVPTVGDHKEEEIFDASFNAIVQPIGQRDERCLEILTGILDTLHEVEMRIRTGNFDAPHPVHSAVHSLIALLGLGPKDVITLKSLMEREREATTTTPLIKEFAARVHTEITGLHDRYHLSYDDPISREQSE